MRSLFSLLIFSSRLSATNLIDQAQYEMDSFAAIAIAMTGIKDARGGTRVNEDPLLSTVMGWNLFAVRILSENPKSAQDGDDGEGSNSSDQESKVVDDMSSEVTDLSMRLTLLSTAGRFELPTVLSSYGPNLTAPETRPGVIDFRHFNSFASTSLMREHGLNVFDADIAVVCHKLARMNEMQLGRFFQCCYERTQRYHTPYLLLDFILKRAVLNSPSYYRLLRDDRELQSIGALRWMPGVGGQIGVQVVRKLVDWIHAEEFERKHASFSFKVNHWGLRISSCKAEDIMSILTHLEHKTGGALVIKHLSFWEINFTGSSEPASQFVHNMTKSISGLRFDRCSFQNDAFTVSEAEAREIPNLDALRFYQCNMRSVDNSLQHLRNLNTLGIRGHQFTELPVALCRLSGLKVLKIRNGPMRRLPPEISGLTELNTLAVSRNNLGCIPANIEALTNLKHLIIGKNRITSIHMRISRLTSLRTLILDGNMLDQFTARSIGLPELKLLSMRDCGLRTIPDFVTAMPNLQKLICTNNEIDKFPNDLHRWTPNLTCILMGFNQLSSFPETVTKMRRLNVLVLNNNRIGGATILPTFSTMPSLQKLILSYNQLEEMPEYLTRLTTLKFLSMSGCEITVLPSSIRGLENLESLGLTYNNFKGFPQEVTLLTNLKELYLSNNERITDIPCTIKALQRLNVLKLYGCAITGKICDELCSLTRLETLELSNNTITDLPREIGSMQSLKELRVSSNSISAVPTGIENLRELTELDISNNMISALPANIGNLKKLKSLNAGGNRELKEVPLSLSNLYAMQKLDLYGAGIRRFPNMLLELYNLTNIVLASNRIRELPSELGRLPCLKSLRIYNCGLHKLPESIGCLTELQELRVGCNPFDFECFPSWIGNLENLKMLDMRGCDLVGIPDDIGRLTKMEEMTLSNNQLKDLPEGLSALRSMKKLDISGNRLTSLGPWFNRLRGLETVDVSGNEFSERELANIRRMGANLPRIAQFTVGVERAATRPSYDARHTTTPRMQERAQQVPTGRSPSGQTGTRQNSPQQQVPSHPTNRYHAGTANTPMRPYIRQHQHSPLPNQQVGREAIRYVQ